MAGPELITVGNYVLLYEAELAQSVLDDAGIESVLLDDNVGRMLPWIVVGGFKVQVNPEDAEAARGLLTASFPAENAPPFSCPNCNSPEIVFGESAGSAPSLPAPVEVEETCWECQSCGHRWKN